MCAPRASASTSSGCAYSRSIRSRTRRSRARSRRCCADADVLVTCKIVPCHRCRARVLAKPADYARAWTGRRDSGYAMPGASRNTGMGSEPSGSSQLIRSGSPALSWPGSGTSTICDHHQGPSASSAMASTVVATLPSAAGRPCAIAQVRRVALPEAGTQLSSVAPQAWHCWACGPEWRPHAPQRWIRNSPCAAASRNSAVASSRATRPRFISRLPMSAARGGLALLAGQHQRRVVVEYPAVAADQDQAVIVDLALPGLPAGLDDRLGQRRHAPHVIGRQLAAAGVELQFPARAEDPALHERAALALAAEAVVLERDQDGGGGAVIECSD